MDLDHAQAEEAYTLLKTVAAANARLRELSGEQDIQTAKRVLKEALRDRHYKSPLGTATQWWAPGRWSKTSDPVPQVGSSSSVHTVSGGLPSLGKHR